MRMVVADRNINTRSALMAVTEALQFTILGESNTFGDLLMLVADTAPDLILIDSNLPGFIPDVHIPALRFLGLGSRIILFGKEASEKKAALSAGADQFVSKDSSPELLIRMLQSMASRY